MTKISFSTLACPDWDLPKVLAAAANYGYHGVELRGISRELDLWKLPEFSPAALADTRRLFESHGLVVPVLGSSAGFHSDNSFERQRNEESVLRMAEVAIGLGSPAIRVFGDQIELGNARGQTAGWIADSLGRLADGLSSSGVQVWLESHGSFVTSRDLLDIFVHLDNPAIGIVWDPANAFAESGELPTIHRQLSFRVRHVHLKDMIRTALGIAKYVLTGEGAIPFAAIIAELAGIEFGGFVSFEWEKHWHPELADPEVALPHFMKWWRSFEEHDV